MLCYFLILLPLLRRHTAAVVAALPPFFWWEGAVFSGLVYDAQSVCVFGVQKKMITVIK